MVKVLAAVADFERDLIIERTQAGRTPARAEGKHMGRPPKTTAEEKAAIRKLLAEGVSVSDVSRRFTDPKAGEALSWAAVISIRDQG